MPIPTNPQSPSMNKTGPGAYAAQNGRNDSRLFKKEDSDADPEMLKPELMHNSGVRQGDLEEMENMNAMNQNLDEEDIEDVEVEYGENSAMDTEGEETEEEEYKAGGLQKTSQYVVDSSDPSMGEQSERMRRSVEE